MDQPENNRDYRTELQDGLIALFGPHVTYELSTFQPTQPMYMVNGWGHQVAPSGAISYTLTIHISVPVSDVVKCGHIMADNLLTLGGCRPTRVERHQDLQSATYIARVEYITHSLDEFLDELEKKNRRAFDRNFTKQLEDRLD